MELPLFLISTRYAVPNLDDAPKPPSADVQLLRPGEMDELRVQHELGLRSWRRLKRELLRRGKASEFTSFRIHETPQTSAGIGCRLSLTRGHGRERRVSTKDVAGGFGFRWFRCCPTRRIGTQVVSGLWFMAFRLGWNLQVSKALRDAPKLPQEMSLMSFVMFLSTSS